jgi:hypothetical protein
MTVTRLVRNNQQTIGHFAIMKIENHYLVTSRDVKFSTFCHQARFSYLGVAEIDGYSCDRKKEFKECL